MSDSRRITVTLPEPLAEAVRTAVKSGTYASTSDVVRDAVALWQSQADARARESAQLRKAWDEGKASGAARPFDIKAIIGRAEAALKTRRRA